VLWTVTQYLMSRARIGDVVMNLCKLAVSDRAIGAVLAFLFSIVVAVCVGAYEIWPPVMIEGGAKARGDDPEVHIFHGPERSHFDRVLITRQGHRQQSDSKRNQSWLIRPIRYAMVQHYTLPSQWSTHGSQSIDI
jgi:hypothetical protein